MSPASAFAHASLIGSEPLAGATLGAAPETVRLSLSEKPEASLSEIEVLGAGGQPEQRGRARQAPGDPLTFEVPLRRLGKGVYTVSWKVISAVDGHLTEGMFAFGVRVSPSGVAAGEGTTSESGSLFELLARWVFLLGVIALIGGAVAGVARFGGTSGSDLALAAAGWVLAAVGLLALGEAERAAAGSSVGQLLDSAVGKALIWRAAALGAVGLALLAARREPKLRRPLLAVATLAASGLVLAHVDAGHARAVSWAATFGVPAQVAHFAAAGVWFGGLAALLLGFRGAATAAREAAVRRFSTLALASLLLVAASGVLRSVEELTSWGDLLHSGYGLAVLAKLGLVILIAAIAARNRPGRDPLKSRDLEALRRRSRLELAVAVAAVGVAALLGTLSPPLSTGAVPSGLEASGADFGHTVRVELTTASASPGPNLFTARVEDYASGEPIAPEGITLHFDPLDDLGAQPSSLKLRERPGGTYTGSGANLAFDGRWEVDVSVERSGVVTIPLELDLPVPEQFVSVLDIPGSSRAPVYTLQASNGYIRISPNPARPGPGHIYLSAFTVFETLLPIDRVVVTAAPDGAPPKQLPVRRLASSRFAADVEFEPGTLEVGVVARTRKDERLRGVFEIEIHR
ncbi:MAG TPA: copper resistance protein CopC [Solirubrobacterales bacterium]|nr:copper resistance protein CopC [Solirubrobacterales bacterium]